MQETPKPHSADPEHQDNAQLTKFLSFLSHDLRGGLNGAVLMLEVVKRQLAADPKQAAVVDDLDIVRRSILDTISTMERFLNAEKLRLGRVPVKIAPVDVAELLKEIHHNSTYLLKERGVEIDFDAPAELTISSDKHLLLMVLQNLVSNAIKYSRGANVSLQVLAGSGKPPPAGVACRFAVRDRGPGIPAEKVAHLFAEFTRGETYGQKGMGLGLYIARHAAELLGARLWAESTVGAGSTFYLDLTQA